MSCLIALLLVPLCWVSRIRPRSELPRLLWVGVPISGLSRSSSAMISAGYDSLSLANDEYSNGVADEFDVVCSPSFYKSLPRGLQTFGLTIRVIPLFFSALFKRDIVHMYFDGGVWGQTPLRDYELMLWKQAGKKVILFPYGADTFVYSQLPVTPWRKALVETYTHSEEDEKRIRAQINRGSLLADAIIGCIVHSVCLPRVDYRAVLWYPAFVSAEAEPPSTSGRIRVVHAPNHRAIKGTEALVSAIDCLKREGFDVSLRLIEGADQQVVLNAMAEADIVVDQLLFGYALTALDAMAMGKVVITGISDEPMYKEFYSESYLSECPMVYSNTSSILDDLKDLMSRRHEWPELGVLAKDYVEKHHSNKATVELFEGIYRDLA